MGAQPSHLAGWRPMGPPESFPTPFHYLAVRCKSVCTRAGLALPNQFL